MDQADKEILAVGETIFGCVVLGVSLGVVMVCPFSLLLLPVGSMIFLHGMKGLDRQIKISKVRKS